MADIVRLTLLHWQIFLPLINKFRQILSVKANLKNREYDKFE